jgi:hypothetical protein
MAGLMIQARSVVGLCLALWATPAFAQQGPALPLDQQEQVDQGNDLIMKLDQLMTQVDQMAALKAAQCVRATGNRKFCDCIANQTPVAIDFVQYVMITSRTREELNYDKMTADDKKTVDGARAGREKCVK